MNFSAKINQRCWTLCLAIICIGLLKVSSVNANETVTLQLKWRHQFQFAGYYAAIKKGYYREERLDVVLIEGKPGGNEVEEVISGRANFGVGMSDILLSKFQGNPVVLLANIFQHSPSTLLVTRKSGYTSPQDLYNKEIQMKRGPKSAELQAMFLNEGVAITDLNLSEPSWNLANLTSGEVDAIAAYVSSQPFILKKQAIPYTLISPVTYGIDFYGDNLFTSEQEVAEYPERVESFKKASLKGWSYALENPEEIIELILSEYAGSNKKIDREFLLNEAAVYRGLILPSFVELGHINPGRWKHIADTYVRLGMADSDYSLDKFIFQLEMKSFSWDHWTIKVFFIIIMIGVGISLALLIFNRRLKREIVAHKETGAELKKSEEKFRALFEQAGGYCMILDPNTSDGIPVIIDANVAACVMHGYTHEDFIGRPVADIDDDEGKKLVKKRTAEIMTGKPFYVENEHIRKDGTTFSVAVNAKRIDFEGKPPLILTTEYDITKRKIAEDKLRDSILNLDEAVRAGRVGLWNWDLKTNRVYFSTEWKRQVGYEDHEVKDEFYEWQNRVHPDDLDATMVIVESSIKNINQNHRTEFRFRHKDGSYRWIVAQASFTLDGDGKAVKMLGSHLDITEQKKLEAELHQSQKMESIGTLAGGIAHDFNNILSSVLGFTELALDTVEKETAVAEDLQEVYTAGLRAKDLVQQILTFARQSDEKLKPIQIGLIIKEVLKFIRSSIPSTIEIKQNLKSESLIMASSTQVHRVMMNLCTNAAQAMEAKGGILEITLRDMNIAEITNIERLKVKHGDYIEIKVSDTGCGIEHNIIKKIFDPYFTTKGTGEGTGMGLAMVHGIVESYGGKVLVNSTLGEGTVFLIYLPIARHSKVHLHYKKEDLPTGKERILFVDDEVQIAKMASRVLDQLGYSVTTKTCSIEALELFRSKPNDFDLVISDVTMPKMTGDQLSKELIMIRPDIPIILCTGYSKNISVKKSSEIGVKAFAYKPIVKEDLAKTIRGVLDGP